MAQTSTATYKISFKKIARAAAAEVRVHKKLAIISYVLFGVAFLLFILDSTSGGDNRTLEYLHTSGWGVAFAVAGVGIGYFTVLNVFRDMSNQQFSDVSMALPIKSSERFLSKLLSLFYMQTAPLIASVIGGNGIFFLLSLFNYSTVEFSAFEPIFKLFFEFFAASMFIMAITVFCTCCCGAYAESSYFSLILMFVINVLPLYYIYNIIAPSAGLTRYKIDDLIDVGYWGFMYLQYYGEKIIPHCVVGSLISLIVMLLSGLIYIRRDARSVGKPISSRVFFEIIMFGGCATVFSVAFMNSAFGWGLLIAGVIYVIINIVVSRAKINALSFLKWIGKFAATVAVFLLFATVTIKTYGFGLANIRPDTKYLENTSFVISYYKKSLSDWSYEKQYYKSKKLSAEQAGQVIDIYKKHFKNSMNKANPFNIMFGNTHGLEETEIEVENPDPIYKKPSPEYFFRYSYTYDNDNNQRIYYMLEYEDELLLTPSELSAMIDELTELGLVYNSSDEAENPEVYTETY